MLLPPKHPKNDEEEETEEEEGEHPSKLNLIWDDKEMDDIDDDVMEEACVGNDYNVQSKVASTYNNSPCTLKMAMKNTPTTIPSTSKDPSTEKYFTETKINPNNSTTKKYSTSMDTSPKILSDLKLDYDVIKDLKKMKENITVFKLCK
jgi:hypothetical protein